MSNCKVENEIRNKDMDVTMSSLPKVNIKGMAMLSMTIGNLFIILNNYNF